MDAISTQHLFHNGKVNVYAWILYIITIGFFLFGFYQIWLSIKKMNKDEKQQAKKMIELENNLRILMENQYEEIK